MEQQKKAKQDMEKEKLLMDLWTMIDSSMLMRAVNFKPITKASVKKRSGRRSLTPRSCGSCGTEEESLKREREREMNEKASIGQMYLIQKLMDKNKEALKSIMD
jgi:hypothetical protein